LQHSFTPNYFLVPNLEDLKLGEFEQTAKICQEIQETLQQSHSLVPALLQSTRPAQSALRQCSGHEQDSQPPGPGQLQLGDAGCAGFTVSPGKWGKNNITKD